MNLPRYAAYRDSGVEWLGSVPAHWSVQRLKASITACKNGVWGDEPNGSDDDIDCVRVADFDRTRLVVDGDVPTRRSVKQSDRSGRLLARGDLLLEKSGGGEKQPVGQVVLYDRDAPAVCSNFVAKVSLAERMVPRFWMYQHATAYWLGVNIGSIKQTSGIQNLDQSQYFNERGAFPSIDEQAQIAAFLDRETAKIDALIAEQEKLLALLAEKRQATISHAVTRGLDPNVPMKDSGIAWLGEVPTHWDVVMLRRVVERFEQGWSPECDSRPADVGEWGVLKAGCVNGGAFAAGENKALPPTLVARPELEVKSGDVLMSRASGSPKLIGSVAFVDNPPARLMLSDKIFRIGLAHDVVPKFFALAMGSTPLRQQIEQAIGGAEGLANNLPQSSIKEFWIALPPEPEQRQVLARVDVELRALHELGDAAERAVSLLKERRSALIAAAVTGQIDVRATAASASPHPQQDHTPCPSFA
jgi:type I restriction enzyme S subunit